MTRTTILLGALLLVAAVAFIIIGVGGTVPALLIVATCAAGPGGLTLLAFGMGRASTEFQIARKPRQEVRARTGAALG